jgi:SAM-dependent methyltransferase
LCHKIQRLQAFYRTEKALVTSPFITQMGELDIDLLAHVFRSLGLNWEVGTVVDVGCGTGFLSTVFDQSTFYVGLDLVQHETLESLLGHRCRFMVANAQQIPLSDESVDLVMCVDSFEHYPQPLAAAREFHRILKKRGQLFLSVPNYSNIAGLVKRFMEEQGGYSKDSWAPFDYWKTEELEHLLTPAKVNAIFSHTGFKERTFIGYEKEIVIGLFPWLWHPHMPAKIERAITRLVNVFAGQLNNRWPHLSLHSFWRMTK